MTRKKERNLQLLVDLIEFDVCCFPPVKTREETEIHVGCLDHLYQPPSPHTRARARAHTHTHTHLSYVCLCIKQLDTESEISCSKQPGGSSGLVSLLITELLTSSLIPLSSRVSSHSIANVSTRTVTETYSSQSRVTTKQAEIDSPAHRLRVETACIDL